MARIAPAATAPPVHVTQNIDGLSVRVLEGLSAESKETLPETPVIEMHGSIFSTRCTACRHVHRTVTRFASDKLGEIAQTDPSRTDIPVDELPRCGSENWAGSNRYGRCGGLLRPDVVWFGEIPPLMGEIARKMNWCDLLIVVGTSFTVRIVSSNTGHFFLLTIPILC